MIKGWAHIWGLSTYLKEMHLVTLRLRLIRGGAYSGILYRGIRLCWFDTLCNSMYLSVRYIWNFAMSYHEINVLKMYVLQILNFDATCHSFAYKSDGIVIWPIILYLVLRFYLIAQYWWCKPSSYCQWSSVFQYYWLFIDIIDGF